MKLRIGLRVLLTIVVATTARAETSAVPRQTYLDLAEAAFEPGKQATREAVERWRKEWQPKSEWGYAPPASPVWQAGLAGALYDLTKKEEYAEDAAYWLAELPRYKEACPAELRRRPEYSDGLPTLTDFFHLPVYAQAYMHVQNSPAMTPERRATIEASIANSADYIRYFPEWGPMNRAMLRAEGLALAAKALPDHPHAAHWRKLGAILARDSWNQWEEEDAQIYHPIWICALLKYADAINDASLFAHPPLRYYGDYFLHLLSPIGMVPDFGDARWNENWAGYLAFLERAASEYHDPQLKWGAARIFAAMTKEQDSKISSAVGLTLTYAYRWADDALVPQEPSARTEEVLEELIGKKIVFRDGWTPESTYLLLNYRDEGLFARMPRDFLRQTLAVEEERMTHSHSDENSICLFMDGGSVLLHDAGYRDTMPSGPYGAYRADYFHNRLVGRKDKRWAEQPLYEFLRHQGTYHPVTTEKIDFFTSSDYEMSRTRVTDERTGYAADRVIVRLTRDDVFIVFDVVKVLEPDYYTFATLWHGTTVLDRGPDYFVTAVDAIGSYQPPRTRVLLIEFLQKGTRSSGTFPIRRYWQDETAVYQTVSSRYPAGGIETFVTVLTPHDRGADVRPLVEAARLLNTDQPRKGVGVELRRGDDVEYVCVKTDLRADLIADNVRPRYRYDAGRAQYGPIETDASFLYARRSGDTLAYAAANMVKVVYDGRAVFKALDVTPQIQAEDRPAENVPVKWRYWEDSVDLSKPDDPATRWP